MTEDYITDAFTKSEDNVNLEVDNLNVGCITSKNNNFNLDSDGNLTVKTIATTSEDFTIPTLDMIYPIGSIYMNVNSTDPSSLFGGTWEQIKDRFLLSCGDSYSNGATGGSSNVTLGIEHIPNHNHSFSGSTSSNGAHTHTGNSLETYAPSSSNTKDFVRPINNSYSYSGIQIMNSAGEHQHTFSGTTGSVGSGQAHDNMPPYLVVYVWKRVS